MTFWVAGAIVGGGVLSSVIGSHGASQAAGTQSASADKATELQREQWQQGRQDQMPWLNAGTNALAQMQGPGMAPAPWKNFTMADYQADPGYSFRLKEGLKSLDATAANRGGLLSGATLRGAQRYGQDMASQEYGAAYGRYNQDQMNTLARGDMGYNRLAALAGVGGTSASNMAGQGQTYANNAGNTILASGQSQAAGQMGAANSWGNAINQGVSSYTQNNLLNRLYPRQMGYASGQEVMGPPSWAAG